MTTQLESRLYWRICAALAASTLVGCGAGAGNPDPSNAQSDIAVASSAATSKPALQAWRRASVSTPPPTKGCFSKSYPSTTWTPVPCSSTPHKRASRSPAAPAMGPRSPKANTSSQMGGIAGNGTDWFAEVSGTTVQGVNGSFPSTSNITSEYDPQYSNRADSYELQINSNAFASPWCTGYSGCFGWQQFEYSSEEVGGVFIEYWLFNYPPAGTNSCPNGLNVWDSTTCHLIGSVTPVPAAPATELGDMELVVESNAAPRYSGQDWTAVFIGEDAYASSADASMLSLYQDWTEVEFNVVGDFNATEAVFNAGASITANVLIGTATSPGGTWLSCTHSWSEATGEYNNLTLSATCDADQTGQYIQFTESD